MSPKFARMKGKLVFFVGMDWLSTAGLSRHQFGNLLQGNFLSVDPPSSEPTIEGCKEGAMELDEIPHTATHAANLSAQSVTSRFNTGNWGGGPFFQGVIAEGDAGDIWREGFEKSAIHFEIEHKVEVRFAR
ncbi:hypothetical protein PENCOP_c006G07520 [Penicillium coprophilum]|uniref:Uncharacterized protein n=1 Tax=Penicillium coprophilum TaxID=36646 RepID=A0A1V6UN19_9EURO|nr:hypothetical protein PENCOP_c006G07520 [Penicillium coprophilum]